MLPSQIFLTFVREIIQGAVIVKSINWSTQKRVVSAKVVVIQFVDILGIAGLVDLDGIIILNQLGHKSSSDCQG